MTNIEALRKIITDWSDDGLYDAEEANEFLDALQEELDEAAYTITNKKDEIKTLKNKIDDLEDSEEDIATKEVFLGLDTLHYRLEKGNMKVSIQLEHWIDQVKKQNCAGVQMAGRIS